jgi:hypothetical protein
MLLKHIQIICVFHIMETLLYYQRANPTPVPTPGTHASIGATATQVRLKQTTPDLRSRFQKDSTGAGALRFGSDSTGGTKRSLMNGSYKYKTKTILVKDAHLRNRGVRVRDLRPTQDRHEEPVLAMVPRYSWKLKENQVTSNYGVLFQDMPGGYAPQPGDVLRGTSYPRSLTIMEEDKPPDDILTLLKKKLDEKKDGGVEKEIQPLNK